MRNSCRVGLGSQKRLGWSQHSGAGLRARRRRSRLENKRACGPRRARRPAPLCWLHPTFLFPTHLAFLILAFCFGFTSLQPLQATPIETEPPILVPPWFQDSLIYHNSFEQAGALPETNTAGIQMLDGSATTAAPIGLFGHGLSLEANKSFKLHSPVFSPHQPFTISFWWALKEDAKIDTGFNLFGLNGNGYIGHFVRGKGEWCALQRPTGVFQVYYFHGIQNSNLLYDYDLASSVNLKAGVWHHTAAVFRAASTIEIYTDGKKVTDIQIEGRLFRPEDNIQQLECGPLGTGGTLDELIVLDRAVSADAIARYYSVISQMRALN